MVEKVELEHNTMSTRHARRGQPSQAEKMYQTVVDKSFVGIYIIHKGLFRYINTNAAAYAGYTPEELLGRETMTIVHPDDRETLKHNAVEMLKGIRNAPYEYRTISKDGDIRWILETVTSIILEGERVVLGSSMNITDRKVAEELLRESNERFSALFDRSVACVYLHDLNGNFIDANQATLDVLGYNLEEMRALNIASLVSHEGLRKARQGLEDIVKTGGQRGVTELRVKRKDGTYRYVETSGAAVYRDGKPYAILGVGHDITERKRIEGENQQNIARLRKSFGATIQAIATVVEKRDPYTAGHQRRVADLARSIATEMKLTKDQIDGIRTAAMIHDIGKISIPAEILSKPSRLTELEFDMIKRHSQAGYDILKDIEFPWPVARIIQEHHERMNGSGYLQGLKGEETLIETRILAVADVVEAMASHRPYRPARGIEVALEEISKNKGILYDPPVVDACLTLFNEKGYTMKD